MFSIQMISNLLTAPVMFLFIVPLFSFYAPAGSGDISPITSTVVGIIFLAVLPSIPVILMTGRGRLDFEVPNKAQRSIFFVLAVISYGAGATIYHFTNSQAMLFLCMTCVMVTAIIAIINQFWKISVHSTGSAGIITAMVLVLGPWMLPFYLLTLATVVVRIRMGAHDIKQLGAGVCLAVAVTLSVFWLLL